MPARVELARAQLAATQDTLADIADRLGYSSNQHFSNQFKRETGMTPMQYRQAVREAGLAFMPRLLET